MRPPKPSLESTSAAAGRGEPKPAGARPGAVGRATIPAIAIATLGAAAAMAIGALPLIPSWQAARVAAIGAIAVAVVVLIGWQIVTTWHAGRRTVPLAVGIAAGIFALAVTWQVLGNVTWANALRGEDLVASLRDDGSGDEIFIYHLTEIPDGFIAARVAVRVGWMPFERTILEVQEPFSASESSDSSLELMFGIGGDIRYAYSHGRLDPSGVEAGPP